MGRSSKFVRNDGGLGRLGLMMNKEGGREGDVPLDLSFDLPAGKFATPVGTQWA